MNGSTTAKMDLSELASARRAVHATRWKANDLLVLIAAKRYEAEKIPNNNKASKGGGDNKGGGNNNNKSAGLRWKDVEVFCRQYGVNRTAGQCRKRWEKLMTDFKKVYDYQSRISAGETGYFDMNAEEWKLRKLPLNFLHDWYKAMAAWIPTTAHHQRSSTAFATAAAVAAAAAAGAAVHDPSQIMDSTTADNFPSHHGVGGVVGGVGPGTTSSAQASPFTLHLDDAADVTDAGEDDIPEGGDARTTTDVGGGGEEEDGSSQGEDGHLGNEEALGMINPGSSDDGDHHLGAASDAHARGGYKRTRRDRDRDRGDNCKSSDDDRLVRLMGKFLETMGAESAKRTRHEAELLALERQKHAVELQRLALEQHMHSEQLALTQKIANDVSGALKEISASLRYFATEVAKKL